MAIIGALDKTKHFDEFDEPLFGNSGVITPDTRRSRARVNLGITATPDALNNIQAISSVVVGGGAVPLTSNMTGTTVLIPLVTANVTTTLPSPTAGASFEFIFIGSATDAEDWVLTTPATTFFVGGLAWLTHGTPDIEPVYSNGTTHNTLTVNNPAAGCYVRVIGNGTNWAVTGYAVAANTPAFSAV